MSIKWIATNPKDSVNLFNEAPMPDNEFEQLMHIVIHNRNNYDEKLEILKKVKGFFSAEQATNLICSFPRSEDKLKAVMMLEPKLISMSCQEARLILAALFIPEDRLEALQYIKRAIKDANSQEGLDYIVSAFTYEDHKLLAAKIIQSVVPRSGIQIAAGGHLGYGALGSLCTNAPPNHAHVYGPIFEQIAHLPNHGLPSGRNYVPSKSAAYDF